MSAGGSPVSPRHQPSGPCPYLQRSRPSKSCLESSAWWVYVVTAADCVKWLLECTTRGWGLVVAMCRVNTLTSAPCSLPDSDGRWRVGCRVEKSRRRGPKDVDRFVEKFVITRRRLRRSGAGAGDADEAEQLAVDRWETMTCWALSNRGSGSSWGSCGCRFRVRSSREHCVSAIAYAGRKKGRKKRKRCWAAEQAVNANHTHVDTTNIKEQRK